MSFKLHRFAIRFMRTSLSTPKRRLAIGRIVLDDHWETFEASLSFWTKADYMNQWFDGLARILNGTSRSALITSMKDPNIANFIVWWPMWRVGDTVILHNQLLFMDQLAEPFNIHNPYIHVAERRSTDDAGRSIAEWRVPMHQIESFLEVNGGWPTHETTLG